MCTLLSELGSPVIYFLRSSNSRFLKRKGKRQTGGQVGREGEREGGKEEGRGKGLR